MTKREAFEELKALNRAVKDWGAKDPWHDAARDRLDALFDYAFCVNGGDPGPWEMPPVPEGVEP